jgi:drug/metabolite transporter (DMT)-like permease
VTLVLGYAILGERASPIALMAVVIIMTGVLLMARGRQS